MSNPVIYLQPEGGAVVNALRDSTPGIMNDHDALHRIVSPRGEVESFTQYNHEMTGHSEGKTLPDDEKIRGEWRYGGNAYYLMWRLPQLGWRVDSIRDFAEPKP